MLALASAAAMAVGLVGIPVAAADPGPVLAEDSFDRSQSGGWGTADSGERWLRPSGPSGLSVTGGAGLIRHTGVVKPRVSMLETGVRNAAMAFTFQLEGGSAGPSPKVVAILRRTRNGEYRLGARVSELGKIRLSISKVLAGRSAKGLGRSVVVSGLRYRAGDRIRVLAQVVKRDPTRLRMKVWRVGAAVPKRWQIARTDRGRDIDAKGRIGVMSLPTGTPRATTGIRFDDVVVRRVAPTMSSPKSSPSPKSAQPSSGPVRKIPASIDATGSRDVSGELQKFINNTPNGSKIVFRKGGTYRLDRVVTVSNRRGLTLKGNGATLKLTSGGGYTGSAIHVQNGSRKTTIRNLNIVGNHAAAGTKDACCGREHQHGIGVYSAFDTLIEHVDISRVGGDCVNIKDFNAPKGKVWSEGVTIRNMDCRLTGRMGVLIHSARDVLIANSAFRKIGYSVFAFEPNYRYQGSNGVTIRDNTIGSYGLTDNYRGFLLYAWDAAWTNGPSTIRNVKLTRNTVAGNRGGKRGKMLGLDVWVSGDAGYKHNFTITNNKAAKRVAGPVIRLADVKGVTVRGNKQPLSSGRLATFPGSTNVRTGS